MTGMCDLGCGRERREEQAAAQVRETAKAMEALRLQLARFNAALGTANGLRMSLADDATSLETRIQSVLKVSAMMQISNSL